MAMLRSIPDTVRALIAAKLGRCPRCIRSSLYLTLLSWAVLLLVLAVWPNDVLVMLALVLASSLTLLLLSHLVAVTVRVALALRATADGAPEPAAAVGWERREFLLVVAKVTFASLAAVLIAPWIPLPARVRAAADKCNGNHPKLNFNVAQQVCAANAAQAQQAAMTAAAAAACASFDCEDPKKTCVPGGKFTATADCTDTTVKCTGGTLFNCAVTVTAASCKCQARSCKGKHQIPSRATAGGQSSAISSDFPGNLTKADVEQAFAKIVDGQADAFGNAFCTAVDSCIGFKEVCSKQGKPKVEPGAGKRCELVNLPSGPVWQCDAKVVEVECHCTK